MLSTTSRLLFFLNTLWPLAPTEMVRTATPFPMVSLLFVFTAFVISNIGHIHPQRTILAFVSGIFFILSGRSCCPTALHTGHSSSACLVSRRETFCYKSIFAPWWQEGLSSSERVTGFIFVILKCWAFFWTKTETSLMRIYWFLWICLIGSSCFQTGCNTAII